MKSTMEGRDEESRQHRVTGHSPTPGAAAGRKGLRPRRVTLFWMRLRSEQSGARGALTPIFRYRLWSMGRFGGQLIRLNPETRSSRIRLNSLALSFGLEFLSGQLRLKMVSRLPEFVLGG
jgi:hypothetical protein